MPGAGDTVLGKTEGVSVLIGLVNLLLTDSCIK